MSRFHFLKHSVESLSSGHTCNKPNFQHVIGISSLKSCCSVSYLLLQALNPTYLLSLLNHAHLITVMTLAYLHVCPTEIPAAPKTLIKINLIQVSVLQPVYVPFYARRTNHVALILQYGQIKNNCLYRANPIFLWAYCFKRCSKINVYTLHIFIAILTCLHKLIL